MCVYPTSTCLHHLYVSTTSTCLPPLRVYHLYVSSTSTCIPPLRVYPSPHVYSISTCLLYIHMSTHLYVSTLALHSRMKTLLHLHPHSGCSTAERENYFRSIELLVFGYFSSWSLCYMRTRKRRRIHENLLTVGKRTSLPWYSTCMCLHHIYGI